MHRSARFINLLHHVDVALLRESFHSLKRAAAAGSDGVRWEDYQDGLEERLVDLHTRIHTGRYRAQPARRTTIPKADGSSRSLSIWCLEDKIVQQSVTTVLSAVYDCGAAQGAVNSPLLANIYLHYVLDLWSHSWRRHRATGDIIIVRYADDRVLGFQSKADANRFRKDLDDRLAQFALQLHPKKTKLIRFGRFAMQDSRQFDGVKASTFDFLGFTHYCTVTRTSGRFMVGRKTIKRRMISTLKDIKLSLQRRLHRPIAETGQWLQRVLSGHQKYFGVPCNYGSVNFFFRRVGWYWFRSLRRRSQRHRMTVARFHRIMARYFPAVRVIHPYPAVRFDANTQGRSPVR